MVIRVEDLRRMGNSGRVHGKISLRSTSDPEMGGPHAMPPPYKRRKRRSFLRLPFSVALVSWLCVSGSRMLMVTCTTLTHFFIHLLPFHRHIICIYLYCRIKRYEDNSDGPSRVPSVFVMLVSCFVLTLSDVVRPSFFPAISVGIASYIPIFFYVGHEIKEFKRNVRF